MRSHVKVTRRWIFTDSYCLKWPFWSVRYAPKIEDAYVLHICWWSTNPCEIYASFVTIPPSMISPDPIRTITGVKHPYAAVFNAKQQLLVTELSGMKIWAFTREGEELGYHKSPFALLMIESPTGLDMDTDGYLSVASASNHTFTKFNHQGGWQSRLRCRWDDPSMWCLSSGMRYTSVTEISVRFKFLIKT